MKPVHPTIRTLAIEVACALVPIVAGLTGREPSQAAPGGQAAKPTATLRR